MSSLLHPRTLSDAAEAQAPALLAGDAPALTHAGLRAQCDYVAGCLARVGVTTQDRVAIVLPNGAEMASAFLGVASVCAAAPLNPAYREQELEFYLGDLQPKALLIDPALDSPAAAIARRRGIAVLALVRRPAAAAGQFELDVPDGIAIAPPRSAGAMPLVAARSLPPAGPDDVALILHTSGTTSRPKMVPLTQANLAASARHITATLQLGSDDRCLNIMPLFHIHGLIAALLSSLAAGGSVACTPGFDAGRFLDWLAQARPTWITAVPTMYAAIAQLAGQQRARVRSSGLRFLRSSSASLAPQLMAALEEAFGIPVIEAYGMTEAAHQMASNPLPPAMRKPGSVGLAAGPEIAILDPREPRVLAAGATGEIAIRGPNVTAGYLANPDANRGAFSDGWFRTGDQGYFDGDGYLFISGRLKELINRGGEKISPREIDEALLALPGVQQAVAFAIPHRTLGEDVAAAVVLDRGASLGEGEVRALLRERLAPFKVPARIVFVDAIPKGATGKLQRIGLADKLKEQLNDRFVAPRDERERQLVAIWQEVLEASDVGIESNFFALGGDSLRAVRIASRAAELGLAVPVDAIFREPTIARLCSHVRPIENFASPDEHSHGPLRLYGFQRVILQQASARPERFSALSEAVFDLPGAVDRTALERAFAALATRHDAFGLRFAREGERWQMQYLPLEEGWLAQAIQAADAERFTAAVKAAHERFALDRPPLFQLVYSTGAPARIAIVAHHLVADAMSMQIVAEDFASAYQQALAGRSIALPEVPTPLASFLRRYDAAARAGRFHADAGEWLARCDDGAQELLVSRPTWTGLTTMGSLRHRQLRFGAHSARVLAHARACDLAPRDVLLAASAAALRELSERARLGILLMSSGREQPLLGDLSRTVGCLANLVPLVLELGSARALPPILAVVQDVIARLPSSGFSLPAVLANEPAETRLRVAKLLFDSQLFVNYKGVLGPRSPLGPSSGALRSAPCTFPIETMMTQVQSAEDPIPACLALQIHYELVGDELVGDLYYSTDLYDESWAGRLIDGIVRSVEGL